MSFVEKRDSQESTRLLAQNIPQLKDLVVNGTAQNKKEKKKQLSQEKLSLNDLDESAVFDSGSIESRLSPSSDTELDQIKKVPFFSWKRFKSKSERFTSKTSLYGDGNRTRLHQLLTDSSRVGSVTSGSIQVQFTILKMVNFTVKRQFFDN